MTFADLWYLADEASQQAEQTYHRLRDAHGSFMETERRRHVSRRRFRTLAQRVRETGTPYGAHTIVYDDDRLLLVRHDVVDLWVLPGGELAGDEDFREAAGRELREEAGVDADYEGLALATRVNLVCDEYETWGVMPVFAASARTTRTSVNDPDHEISAARWFPFDDLPRDTRDRADLLRWHERYQ